MTNRKLFQQPWGYSKAFLLVIGLFILSLLIEIITNFKPITLPAFPYNIQIAVSYIILLIIVHFIYKNTFFIKWLSGISASISAIVFFTSLTLAIGLFPKSENPGLSVTIQCLHNIQRSWFFVMASIYLLTCLGLVIIRRISNFSKRNLGFLANHLGLWLIIFSGSLGSGDQKSYFINLEEGKTNEIGCNQEGDCVKFPFRIKLIYFHIDEFPPKIALVQYLNDSCINTKFKNNLFQVEKGIEKKVDNFKIKVEEYLPSSILDTTKGFIASNDTGASPSAYVSVKDIQDNLISQGWITCGSFKMKPQFIVVNNNYYVEMNSPEPKKYNSLVDIISKKVTMQKQEIIVNKPLSILGWKLYQVNYDTKMGRFSKISILEAVRDPWLPLVYLGMFLLIAGSIYLFWNGNSLKQTEFKI